MYSASLTKKAKQVLRETDCDALLLATEGDIDPSFFWFTGISKIMKPYGFLIIRKGRKPLLIFSPLEYGQYVGLKRRGFDVVQFNTKKDISSVLGKIKGKVGMNMDYWNVNSFRRVKKMIPGKIKDVSKELENIRSVKTKDEINKIKSACRMGVEILESVPDLYKKGMKEVELKKELEIKAMRNGAEGMAFPTIVASGKNSAVPHHTSSNKIIRKGFLVVDFGVVLDGYCSDNTRTFFIGKPEENDTEVYETVWEAQKAAKGSMKSGVKASDVHKTGERVIKKNTGKVIPHSIGHGLGIMVHDSPGGMSTKSDFRLRENMVMTVEPGFYKNGYGGVRIEDAVVVKKKKCVEMTKTGKDMVVL